MSGLETLVELAPQNAKTFSPSETTTLRSQLVSLLSSEPNLFSGSFTLKTLVDSELLSDSSIIGAYLSSKNASSRASPEESDTTAGDDSVSETAVDSISAYVAELKSGDLFAGLVACISEFKNSTKGGIIASRNREKRFFFRLFGKMEELCCSDEVQARGFNDDWVDDVSARVIGVRLVPFLQQRLAKSVNDGENTGGEGLGWKLIQRIFTLHPETISKVFQTSDDFGESILQFLEPPAVPTASHMNGLQNGGAPEGDSSQDILHISAASGSALGLVVDETMPEGFADTSMAAASHFQMRDDSAVAASAAEPGEGPWLLNSGASTPRRDAGNADTTPRNQNRLSGMDDYLETPKPLQELYKHMESLENDTERKCM